VKPDNVFYEGAAPEDAGEIIARHMTPGERVDRLLHKDQATGRLVPKMEDIEFFRRQQKIVLRNCGNIDPLSIDDYIVNDGYQALARILSGYTQDKVIEEMKVSGLRGRGGAGFPTWKKWSFTKEARGDVKYVLCNADEGDPGAFMDRSVLEGDPHSVIEGNGHRGLRRGREGRIRVRARRIPARRRAPGSRDPPGARVWPAR